jgi:hypothetical protein
MGPLFGAHYRVYRLKVALDRLRDMPVGTTLRLSRAAQLLGTSEATVRTLAQRYAPGATLDGDTIGVATLRHVVRKAYEARKQR